MTTQEENERICEKVLGWTRGEADQFGKNRKWLYGSFVFDTPTFLTGDEMLLILGALEAEGITYKLGSMPAPWCSLHPRNDAIFCSRQSLPSAVRAAAISFSKRLK